MTQERKPRGETKTYTCKWSGCRREFVARIADRNRGWARFCSKRCKAKEQESRTHQNAEFNQRRDEAIRQADHEYACAAMEEGWDGHKDTF